MPAYTSRRQFLKRTAIIGAAITLLMSGSWWPRPTNPRSRSPEKIIYGDPNPMNKKILVAYVTRAGSTAEIAQEIAKTLSAQGAAVDVLPLKNVTGL